MSLTMEAFHRGITPPAAQTLRTYGLTQDEWIALLKAQGWVCPICLQGNDRPKTGKKALWNTDHEHVRGWAKMPPEKRKRYVRGILCFRCNRRVVGDKKDPAEAQRLADYLAAFRARLEGKAPTGPRPLAQQFAQVREALDEPCLEVATMVHETMEARAALSAIERRVQDMEKQAALDAERAAVLSSAVGKARLILNDASAETTALIDAALPAREREEK